MLVDNGKEWEKSKQATMRSILCASGQIIEKCKCNKKQTLAHKQTHKHIPMHEVIYKYAEIKTFVNRIDKFCSSVVSQF